ncbi:(2Fe-2S)-binding protein [Flexivirga caeni]|uniref:(2Fe-2S)-binding protein n=2 Tax=Flexivirga caeni TaxID=2294115 RepID=A0A3M9M0G8_9MICO|nr:(2Fe-2S)-binding protein [Flexivirga caeni]
MPPAADPTRPPSDVPITITLDGTPYTGTAGQTLAGVLLGAGRLSWRTSPGGASRGVFCGIGVCFDCIATVNDACDVRLCQRRAVDGDRVVSQGLDAPLPLRSAGTRPAHGVADV